MPQFGGAPKCAVCEKSAYANESMSYSGKTYHTLCFKCKECNKAINGVAGVAEFGGDVFHKNCFVRVFKETGGKYGGQAVVPGGALPGADGAEGKAVAAEERPVLKPVNKAPEPEPAVNAYAQAIADGYPAGYVCFLGDGEVTVAGGNKKQVKDVQVGDQVVVDASGSLRRVELVRVTPRLGHEKVVRMDGFHLTWGHPVIVDGEWSYPWELVEAGDKRATIAEDAQGAHLYNFELDGTHTLRVNNTIAGTLGSDVGSRLRSRFPWDDAVVGTGYWQWKLMDQQQQEHAMHYRQQCAANFMAAQA